MMKGEKLFSDFHMYSMAADMHKYTCGLKRKETIGNNVHVFGTDPLSFLWTFGL